MNVKGAYQGDRRSPLRKARAAEDVTELSDGIEPVDEEVVE